MKFYDINSDKLIDLDMKEINRIKKEHLIYQLALQNIASRPMNALSAHNIARKALCLKKKVTKY